jgi:hypothetical protein
MPHKFAIGAAVYYEGGFLSAAARGAYKIVKQLPVERDNRIAYRIKSPAEAFERIAEESQLRRSADLP